MGNLVRYKILVIGQDQAIPEMMALQLDNERFSFLFAETGTNSLQVFLQHEPDIVLIDLILPDTDGIMLCRELREQPTLRLPIIFIISDQTASYCEIEAFRSGADDYIRKPINPEAFRVRLQAFLKRASLTADLLGNPYVISIDNIQINTNNYIVYLDNKILNFQKKEVQVLALLVKNPGVVFTRKQIIQEVWKNEVVNSTLTIDVRIHKIRKKIGEARIKTIKKVGYMFMPESHIIPQKLANMASLLPFRGN